VVAPGPPPRAHEPSLLPLRLSVARGRLSVELTRPHALSGLLVEALEVELDGAAFPVDLSRGVKQFRNRRGRLRQLLVRLDLDVLGRYLLAAAEGALGQPAVGIRISPAPLIDGPPELLGVEAPRADNDARPPALGMVAVSLFGMERAVAFELVLAPGHPPSFIVDNARGLGLEGPALGVVLSLLERGLSASPLGFVRQGRSIQLAGLARALLTEIMPTLGFRVPKIEGHVVHRAVFGLEGIALMISADQEPCPVGARAVRLAGLTAFTTGADDRLALGDLEGARSEFLDVLERVPGHAEVLLNLAEIDCANRLRSESALSFLEEAQRGARDTGSRVSLIAHRALLGGLRRELSLEALEQAIDLEADGTLAALCHCALAANSEDPVRALAELDSAVSRAPSHPQPRWLRLEQSLRARGWQKALVDAQQLEALAAPGPARAHSLHRIGRSFSAHGRLPEAVAFLRRALTSNPDEASILLDLARALEASGEGLRAAELYQMALARAEPSEGARAEGARAAELDVDAVRLALARLLARETGDLSLALGYVKRVGARAKEALSAREFEITLARQLGDIAALRSAALRLIQGLELGWIARAKDSTVLADLEGVLRELGQDDLAEHAARLAHRTS
jgi:tetratricopeptide (TPR) repeat protein